MKDLQKSLFPLSKLQLFMLEDWADLIAYVIVWPWLQAGLNCVGSWAEGIFLGMDFRTMMIQKLFTFVTFLLFFPPLWRFFTKSSLLHH